MVLGLVSRPAKIHYTAIFALLNSESSKFGGLTHPHTLFKFRPTEYGRVLLDVTVPKLKCN